MQAIRSLFSSNTNEEVQVGEEKQYYTVSPYIEQLLKKCVDLKETENVSVDEIIENSSKFPIAFPKQTFRVKKQPENRHSEIEFQANSVRPVVQERVVWLYLQYLEHKIMYGDDEEKQFYRNIGICEFVQRLLEKRCVVFVNFYDAYTLMSGESGVEIYKTKVPLDKLISYEEVKLSAFLSVSSHTEFINDGRRSNLGKVEEDKSKIETDGVIIGLIGARFQRPGQMEYQDIVVDATQNRKENGYGSKISEKTAKQEEYRKLWNEFYNDRHFLYEEAEKHYKKHKNQRFVKIKPNYFDKVMMTKRFAVSFDTLLLEANSRAGACNKLAYIHVVGIGLGVWKICDEQDEIFLETFGQCIQNLKDHLNHVGYIDFSWFQLSECKGIKNDEIFPIENHPNGGIRILFSKRNPHEKLNPEKYPNCLVVASWAWDANSLPGNEFWKGCLASSSDPAAACSTLISELHNPHINRKKCNGFNLHVATRYDGVIHIRDFAKKILGVN